MRILCGTILAAALASNGEQMAVRDPAIVWDIERLKESPRVREYPKEFRGEATPVFIEGEPYRGRETWCFAYYGVPEWATATNPAPGIVLIHGGAGTAYPEWVRMWVRRGYAAVCVDTCGALPIKGADGKWLANPEGGPRGWGRIECADEPEREQWVYHAVAAVMRSHSFLRSLPKVDKRNIGVTGISWGGFLTCILAAADDRFAYAVPVYGCGFNYERGGSVWSNPLVGRWSELWDASVFLPFAKCPMLWVDGTNDFAFSLDRVRRSAALAPVEHVFSTHLRMVHGHGEPGEGPREILAFADHFAKGGADVVRFGECKLDGNCFTVKFDANGRRIVRAELLYTLDGMDVKWDKRLWRFAEADALDAAAGVVSAALPAGAFAWIVNLVTHDGLVFSTPYRERETTAKGEEPADRPVPCQVSVSVGEREFKTYPFSDPDPVPATSERRYPYFRYDGSTDVPEQRVWKTVTLESDRLAVTILPEVGGKVWGAYDKVVKRDFLYANHVMKFRDIAMRGPWVSGGIEFNFGVIGHSPCTSTPVDWHVRTNGDGSASCFVGGMEYITRSFWQVEVVLKGGADEFETRTVWYNASGTPAPYYQWMNAAYSLRDDPEFLFDGKSAVGHGGEILTRTWPIDAKGRDVSLYRNNCYGGPKSLHFVGGDGGFYGIWWRDLGYGSWHRSLPYEKYGRKLFIWALSREGGIWEDLLTDGDGQYAELQSGRCLNQPRRGNVYSPFKHPTFAPGTAETFADRWGPLRSREEAKSDAAAPKPRPIDPAPGIDWSSPRAQAVLGIQALRTRDDCKGEDMLKEALAKDGTLVDAILGLAELAYRRGQYSRVHELAEKAMSFDLYDHAANYLDGAAYFAEGDMPSARERLGVAAFSGGWRAAAMAMIARSFLREGDAHAALAAAEESLRSEGLQMDALLVKAIALRGAPVREAFLANVLKRLPLAHQFRYELEGVDALRRAVSCELPHETFLEIGSWYEETGLAEDARRIFRLALPNPEAEMRLAFLEHRPPVLGMRVEGAFPFRRESRPALEAAAGRDGWKAKYLLAVLKGFFHETEASSALLESCGDEPDESVFYLYRARSREGKRRMDDLLRARETGDSWRVGRDIMEAYEKSGDLAQMLSTAEEYLRRFPTKNPLQIGYARALMKRSRHAECMEYLKGVKILPSEHRDSATGIWHECQKALGLQPTWPENLGQGEPYHDGEWRQTE